MAKLNSQRSLSNRAVHKHSDTNVLTFDTLYQVYIMTNDTYYTVFPAVNNSDRATTVCQTSGGCANSIEFWSRLWLLLSWRGV